VLTVADHVKVPIAEYIEALAKYCRVEEFILAEYVDGFVGNDRPCEQQHVLCPRAQPVHGLGSRNVMGFNLVAFVGNNHVGVPCGKFLFQTPCRFIIDHRDLQGRAAHVPQGIDLLCGAAFKNRKAVIEIRELGEFLFPYAEDGERGHHQNPADFTRLIQSAGDRDACQTLSGAHVYSIKRATPLDKAFSFDINHHPLQKAPDTS
jgi:hypothetical protein